MRLQIFDTDNWREIAATLGRNKTRTFLTGFGIFWGVAMLAVLLGGARGAEDMLRRNFDGFATNCCFAWPKRTTMPYKGNAKDRAWSVDLYDVERLRQGVPEMQTVTYILSSNYNSMRNGRRTYSGQVEGVEPQYLDCTTPSITAGRFINTSDLTNNRRVAVVGKKIVSEIFPDEPAPLGRSIDINGVQYTIIGVQEQTNGLQIGGTADEMAVIPATTFRRAYNRGLTVDMIYMVARPGERIADLLPRIRRLIYDRHYVAPDDEAAMQIFDISENFEQVETLFSGLTWLAAFIGLSTLIAGIIGIGNIMWIIVKERTQEIGIRRAIGARPRDIIIQILSEGLVLTLVAGLAGICFAAIILFVAQLLTANPLYAPARFQMTLGQAAQIMAVFIVLGTAAGLIPAVKAMRIKPVEAINDK